MEALQKKYEHATQVKKKVLKRYAGRDDVMVGLSNVDGRFALKVNFRDLPDLELPQKIEGLDVIIDTVGRTRAYGNKERQHIEYHVLPTDGAWAVKRKGAKKISSRHRTQREAIRVARTRARKQRGELVVHGKNGTVRDRNLYLR